MAAFCSSSARWLRMMVPKVASRSSSRIWWSGTEGQLDFGIAVGQHVERVVVVHAAFARVPLQDDLLEGLEGEGAVDPALADGIAEGVAVAGLDEVPQGHVVGVGDGEPVIGILRVAAGDGEEAAAVEGNALALEGVHGRGERREQGDDDGREAQALDSAHGVHPLPRSRA